jgi:hypothetical protein
MPDPTNCHSPGSDGQVSGVWVDPWDGVGDVSFGMVATVAMCTFASALWKITNTIAAIIKTIKINATTANLRNLSSPPGAV